VRLNDDTLNWEIYKALIDKNEPIMLLVDSSADGETDHFIPAFGYDDTTSIKMYAAYNTWDGAVHWYRWGPMVKGTQYGVYGGTILTIEHAQPTQTPTSTLTPFPPTYTPFDTPIPATTVPSPTMTITGTPAVEIVPTETATPVIVVQPSHPLAAVTNLDLWLFLTNLVTLTGLVVSLFRIDAIDKDNKKRRM
jgi:hypothetical protein